VEQVVVQRVGGLAIELEYEDHIYYASVINGLPFLKRLSVTVINPSESLPASVAIEVKSLGQTLTAVWEQSWGNTSGATQAAFTEFSALQWNASRLWDLTERHPAEILVTLPGLDEPLVFAAFVENPRTWLYSNEDSLSALAAFVQPNHPSLRPVLDAAVEKLRARKHSPALSGYQDLSHVPAMVEAIYDAVSDLGLTYSDPPASWSDAGQKIRDAQTILDERVGTCLDTALFFAGLLENVGLNPVVAVVPGHAFVGYWVDEKTVLANESIAIRDVVTLIEGGAVQLFETTVVCRGPGHLGYADAVNTGTAHIQRLDMAATTHHGAESSLVDIRACRHISVGGRVITPMPARFVRPDGGVDVVEYRPEELSIARLIAEVNEAVSRNKVSAKGIDTDVPPRLKKWLDDLLDLSLTNPLINFRAPVRSLAVMPPLGALGTLEDLLHQSIDFEIRALTARNNDGEAVALQADRGVALDSKVESIVKQGFSRRLLYGNYDPAEFLRRARSITSNAKAFMEETGTNGLFLAIGSLVWVPEGKKEVRSPLILVPVRLTPKARNTQFVLSLDTSSEVTPNFSLAEKLRRELNLKLDDLVNLKEDDSGIDVPGTLQHIRERLTEARLEGFRVDENAVLGFFDFSTYRLWRDLIDNWRKYQDNSLVKHLIFSPNDAFEDPIARESDLDLDQLIAQLPIEADSSQVLAVAQASAGKTFIMQGPPGTGKSQTITNMLARAMHDGKRVLFVAEKKDALDVVVERLEKSGLRPFILDLHDKGMSFKAVKEQLASVVDLVTRADRNGFEAALREYSQSMAPLQKYRNELHAVGTLGESLSSALDKLLSVAGDATVEVPGSFMTSTGASNLDALLTIAETIADIGPAAGTVSTNPWSLTTRAEPLSGDELAQLKTALATLTSTTHRLGASPAVRAYLSGITDLAELPQLAVVRRATFSAEALAASRGAAAREARLNAINSLDELRQVVEAAPGSYSNIRALALPALLQEVTAASTAFLGGMKISKIRKLINRTLGWDAVGSKVSAIADINALISVEKRAVRLEQDLERVSGIRIETDFDSYSVDSLLGVRETIERLDEVSVFVQSQHDDGQTGESFLNAVNAGNLTDDVLSFCDAATSFVTALPSDPQSLNLWRRERPLGQAFLESIPQWANDATARDFVDLTRWCALLVEINKLNQAGLNTATESVLTGGVTFGEFPSAFLRGYYTSLIELLMVQRGFHNFDGIQLDSYVRRLSEAQKKLSALLPDVLAQRLFENRGFDASSRLGAVGDLLVILSQQRAPRGMGVRALLTRFWDVITRMTPCVLASPDSTVRFIASQNAPFDLVVFDEASQIRVAHSLGAIGRGQATVIAGDTKQMPPTSVAKVSNDGVESEDPANPEDEDVVSSMGDAESILSQCEVSRVPQVMLNWHYRSEDESLIAFSNAKYYDRKLLSFPSPDSSRETKGLSFEFISDGVFMRPGMAGDSPLGTNLAEAKEIIAEISRRAADEVLSDDSVGIVTFNKPQRDLIESMLFDSTDPHIQRALVEGLGGEEIFVKNLESVQGKERDVILFSIAFSKNSRGEVPLNFGPLNNAGGQRRLNVAITRARKQVKVFCSFMPTELIKRNPNSVGVRHLAEFLDMAVKGAEANPAIFAESGVRADRLRGQIASSLRAAGFTVKEDLGLSGFKVDLAIYETPESDRAVLGVLLDGPSWNQRQTVVDRDVLPAGVLKNKMGWPAVERIWLPSWHRDSNGEIERLRVALQSAVEISQQPRKLKDRPKLGTLIPEGDIASAPSGYAPLSVEHQPDSPAGFGTGGPGVSGGGSARTTSTGAVLDGLQQFLVAQKLFTFAQPSIYGPQSTLDRLFEPGTRTVIRGIVQQLTAHEGPVSPARLGKFVGACYSFSRLAAQRLLDINALTFPGHSRDDEGFLYPAGVNPAEYTEWRFCVEGLGEARTIDEISLREISNSAVALCRAFQGVEAGNLKLKLIPTLFNIQRVTPRIEERIVAGISVAIKEGRLTQSGDYLKAV
jgi:hypothetical protein